jgi:hypothetical protein
VPHGVGTHLTCAVVTEAFLELTSPARTLMTVQHRLGGAQRRFSREGLRRVNARGDTKTERRPRRELAAASSAFTAVLDELADSQAATAEFNRNVLRLINRELGGDFPVDAFEHVAFFDCRHEWVEMRLRSQARQV